MICFHSWQKIEKQPHETYIDISGFRVGVFKCMCIKCGKVKNRKYF